LGDDYVTLILAKSRQESLKKVVKYGIIKMNRTMLCSIQLERPNAEATGHRNFIAESRFLGLEEGGFAFFEVRGREPKE
jgi:hypothetical protein